MHVLTKAKLIVSIDESRRVGLEDRIPRLLAKVGILEAVVLPDAPAGLVLVSFPGNPKEPVERLAGLCEASPELFDGTHQWTPIEAWTTADAPSLTSWTEKFVRRMSPWDRFQFELRQNGQPEFEVATPATDEDVGRLPKILRVEIIGDEAGVSLLDPVDLLDVDQVPRRAPDAASAPSRAIPR